MNTKTIIQYNVLNSTHAFARGLTIAVYVTYLMAHGLDPLLVNLVNLVFFITLFISEVPTGAFADIFGRKRSFVIACFLTSVGTCIYGFSSKFSGFILAEFTAAVGATFASGAFKAWLVDKLKHHGYTEPLQKVFSKSYMWSQISTGVGVIIGAWLYDINITYPWFLESTIMLTAGLIASLWLKEEYFVKQKFSIKLGLQSMKETVSQSVHFSVNNHVVKFLIVIGLIQIFAVQGPNMQWQPYFAEYLGNQKHLGMLGVGIVITLTIGALFANKLLLLIKDEKKALMFCQISTGVGIAVITLLPYPLGILAFLLHELPRGMYGPLKDRFLQDNIPSCARATISSFEASFPHVGAIFGLLSSGILAKYFGIPASWIVSGTLMVVLSLFFVRNGTTRNGLNDGENMQKM